MLTSVGMTVELGLRNPPKKREQGLYQKHCNKKCLYHQKFLIFHDTIDATVPFLQISQNHELVITSF